MERNLTIDKSALYLSVMEATEYVSMKMEGEEPSAAYARIAVTDHDKSLLDRYFIDSLATVVEKLRAQSPRYTDSATELQLSLSLPRSFEESLWPSIREDFASFMVNSMLAKWFMVTNRKESEGYEAVATTKLTHMHRMVCQRKRPARPSYN